MSSSDRVRAGTLVLLVAIAGYLPRVHAQTFSDVPANYWAYSYIQTLAESGVTSGCGGGKYCPEAEVTRAQMAVFLERGMKGSSYAPPAATGAVFSDVAANAFAASFIEPNRSLRRIISRSTLTSQIVERSRARYVKRRLPPMRPRRSVGPAASRRR